MVPILALHIPDGFLSVPVALVGWVLMAAFVALALRLTREHLGERQVPLLGVLAAFVFAAQMINFPVAGGTSGHLIGGTLVAIFLGPWAAVLVMTTVVGVQALLFQDGGLLALGFNITNMGIVAAFVGYSVYHWGRKLAAGVPNGDLIAAAVAAWASVQLAAAATTLELVVSDTSPLDVALPAMLGVHALIGIGEALITVGALAFVRQTRPDLVQDSETAARRGAAWISVGLLITLAVAFASPLASPEPDGLERVAEDKNFIEQAEDAVYEILPDYTVPFIENDNATTIAAGVIGVAIVAALAYGVAMLVRRRQAAHSVPM